jgi:hypothetical protein
VGKLLVLRVLLRARFLWTRPDPIQSELVALAAEVAAAATSTRAVLARVPEGRERTRLLGECDCLWGAAEEVLDPRCQLQGFARPQLEEIFEIFMEYQAKSVSLRSAVHRLAGVPEISHSKRRRGGHAGDLGTPQQRMLPCLGSDGHALPRPHAPSISNTTGCSSSRSTC